MLAPDDRELLLAAIRPDPGYTLDHALITTYSLDLDALLGIPVALTFNAWSGGESRDGEETAGGDRLDPVALLHSLRSNADRLTVVGQAGTIAEPKSSSFLSFLEPVVHGVSAPVGGVFHPKLWLLRYQPADPADPVAYKLLCLTRNLTFDRSWDLMLRLDATLDPDGPEREQNLPLRTFVEGVAGLAADSPGALTVERRSQLARMAAEVPHLDLHLPEGYEEASFWPLGFIDASPERVFGGRRDRTLVVSPFVTDGFLERLDLGPDDTLVSRPEELALLGEEARSRPGAKLVLGDIATEPDFEQDELATEPKSAEELLSGLHTKLVVADAGWKARTWTGSANATTAAFGANVELLVELSGLKSATGIDRVLGGPGEAGLESLLVPYFHDPSLARDAELRRLEERIEGLARELGSAALFMRADRDEELWCLTLATTGELPPLPEDLEVAAWPATLSDHRARPLRLAGEGLTWGELDVIQLTGFLCLSIRSPAQGYERRVAIALPLEGAPPDRSGAVARSVLADQQKVLRYLLFLLEDPDSDAMEAVTDLADDAESTAAWLGFTGESTLFEALVRSLYDDPVRIDSVERLLGDLGEDEAETLLPAGFSSVFEPIREARRRAAR